MHRVYLRALAQSAVCAATLIPEPNDSPAGRIFRDFMQRFPPAQGLPGNMTAVEDGVLYHTGVEKFQPPLEFDFIDELEAEALISFRLPILQPGATSSQIQAELAMLNDTESGRRQEALNQMHIAVLSIVFKQRLPEGRYLPDPSRAGDLATVPDNPFPVLNMSLDMTQNGSILTMEKKMRWFREAQFSLVGAADSTAVNQLEADSDIQPQVETTVLFFNVDSDDFFQRFTLEADEVTWNLYVLPQRDDPVSVPEALLKEYFERNA